MNQAKACGWDSTSPATYSSCPCSVTLAHQITPLCLSFLACKMEIHKFTVEKRSVILL